jgi:hypothetical protein
LGLVSKDQYLSGQSSALYPRSEWYYSIEEEFCSVYQVMAFFPRDGKKKIFSTRE